MWDDVYIVDPNVFDVFSHDFIYGSPVGALDDRLSLAVSETFATTYFGDENPVGKLVSTDQDQYHITAVFADLPDNSHMKYDVLFSKKLTEPRAESPAQLQRVLGSPSEFTYLLMAENFDPSEFPKILDNFTTERLEAMTRERGVDFTADFIAQNLPDVHLDSSWDRDLPTGNILYIYGFSAVALFILVIACINYVNLATARSLQRAREVGMRKVLGAERSQLMWQFLGESLFFVLVALAIALSLVYVLIDSGQLENLVGKPLDSAIFFEPRILFWLLGLSVAVGLLSGLYPAFYLSAIAPMVALSNNSKNSKSTSGRLRQLLVLVQFSISIGVISSTLLMANQMRFVANLSLGFDKENKLLVRLRGADVVESVDALRNELGSNTNIFDVSLASQVPGDQIGSIALNFEDQSGVSGLHVVSVMNVGEDFMQTMGIDLLEGRDFRQKLLTDVNRSLVVNQALVDKMGWTQAVGRTIDNSGGGTVGSIIGIMEDFHFESLYKSVAPLIMMSPRLDFANASPNQRSQVAMTLVVNISGNEIPATLNFIRDLMLKFDPRHPFEFEFLDDRLNKLYESEENVMRLTAVFSAICIFISCLGLFGLASFTTEQRTREIGIRKVLGATRSQIIVMLARNILTLVVIGAVIASFTSYYAVSAWLDSFAYRETINPLSFSLAATLALVVAFVTVALQSLKTVRANPVQALRYE